MYVTTITFCLYTDKVKKRKKIKVPKASNGTRTITCVSFNHIQFLHRRINIVLTKESIHTLVDVVIIDPTLIDLLPQSYTTQRFIAFNATQAKERNYHNQHPTNQFFLLVIEVFGCLLK
jgi:hypothetical protein